jgi:N-acyl-D-amino-acid deacylase
MSSMKISAGQVAVGRKGEVLFSKGLGTRSPGLPIPVEPQTLFRIASISKPLTAAAVLCLVEDGVLTMESRMMDVLKPDIFSEPTKKLDERIHDITIRHLLQHLAGWNRDKSGDPMFQSNRIAEALHIAGPPTPAEVVRVGLGRPLDTAPGAAYAYSNFGYCVLGRIIEKITAQPYAAFVKKRVLQPVGALSARLGASLKSADDEVSYTTMLDSKAESVFSQVPGKVPWPYGGFCLEHMDAHGGWIANAEDLVRFAMSLDDIGGRSPFKKRETWETMIEEPNATNAKRRPQYYGCGILVAKHGDAVSISHDGSLPGTSTFLYRRGDGITWAALFNQRDEIGKRDGEIVPAIQSALAS